MEKKCFTTILLGFIFLFLVSLNLISFISATNGCSYVGQVINDSYYCDIGLNMQPLKGDGQDCVSDFECFNFSCIDGLCQPKYTSVNLSYDEERSFLQVIFNLVRGIECSVGEEDCDETTQTLLRICNENGVWEDVNSRVDGKCGYILDWDKSIDANQIKFYSDEGYNVLVNPDERILFNLQGEEYFIGILEGTTTDKAKILIGGNSLNDVIYLTINEGSVAKLKLLGGDEYDFSIVVNSISDELEVNLTLKALLEEDSLFWLKTYDEANVELEDKGSLTKIIHKKERIKIKIENAFHYIGVIDLTISDVVVNVSSRPQQEILDIGETEEFEVTEDDYYDLSVTINNISLSNEEVNLTIKPVSTRISDGGGSGDSGGVRSSKVGGVINEGGVTTTNGGITISSDTGGVFVSDCGDGYCDSSTGETSVSCEEDCPAKQRGFIGWVLLIILLIILIAFVILFIIIKSKLLEKDRKSNLDFRNSFKNPPLNKIKTIKSSSTKTNSVSEPSNLGVNSKFSKR